MSKWINVEGAIKDVKELTRQLTGEQLAKGISRGINKTLLQGRTQARKAVKDEYNIPQNQLKGVDYNKSTSKTLTGSIGASTKPIPLMAFNPQFETPTKKIRVSKKGEQRVKERGRRNNNPGKGVSVEIHRGARVNVPFAFMIAGAKPHVFARGRYASGVSVFVQRNKRERATGTDIHINPLMSVTIHQAVVNDKSINRIAKEVETDFPKNLTHELKFLISKLPKG